MSNFSLSERLSQVIPVLPEEGIAFRGDALQNASGSLQRDSANYIVFSPDPDADTQQLATELEEGVSFALQFSYPYEWGENPANPIPDVFDGYSSHYTQYPNSVPALSWGVASYPGQLTSAKRHGRGFYGKNSFITAGSVEREGPIAALGTSSIIPVTLEELQHLEENTQIPVARVMKATGVRTLRTILDIRKQQSLSRADYLKGRGRADFHARLSSLMTRHLLDSAESEFRS